MRRSKRSKEAKSGSRSPSPIDSLLNNYNSSEDDASSVKSKRKNAKDYYWTRVLSLSYRNINFNAKYSVQEDKEISGINP